jgi:hypothetical protein
MSATVLSLDTELEESSTIDVVSQAENDPSYPAEPEILIWNFDPGICG